MNNTKEVRIWLPGRIPSKKNSKQRTKYGIISSKSFLKWEKESLSYLKENYADLTIPWKELEISCYFWWPCKRTCDTHNKYESVADLLVDAGIIKDDNYTILENTHLYSQKVQKDYPGVLIIIKPATPNLIEHPMQAQIDADLEKAAAIKAAKKTRKPRAKKVKPDLDIAA